MKLTSDQLVAINRHLRKENWLYIENLIAELTDHYVVGLEDRIANGMTFDAALHDIHASFGGRKGLLKMEEAYQVQKDRRSVMHEWCKVRTFFSGNRLAVTLGVFAVLYYMNGSASYQSVVGSLLRFIELPLQVSLMSAVFAGAVQNWVWYDRGVADKPLAVPALTPFVKIYGLSYVSLVLIAFITVHLNGPMWSTLHVLTITLAQTLAITYMIGILVALRTLFIKKIKTA